MKTDFGEIFWRCGAWPRDQSARFWWRSRSRPDPGLLVPDHIQNPRLLDSPRSRSAMQLATDLASYRLLVDLSRLAVSLAITSMTSFTDVIFNLLQAAVN